MSSTLPPPNKKKKTSSQSPLTNSVSKPSKKSSSKSTSHKSKSKSNTDNANNASAKAPQAPSAEESALTSLLFGSGSSSRSSGSEFSVKSSQVLVKSKSVNNDDEEEDVDVPAWDDDDDGDNVGDDDDDEEDEPTTKSKPKPKPVWTDDDVISVSIGSSSSQNRVKKLRVTKDEDVIDGSVYEKRLKSQREGMLAGASGSGSGGFTSWADVDSDDNSDDSDDKSKSLKRKNKIKSKKNTVDNSSDDSDGSDSDDASTPSLSSLLTSTLPLLQTSSSSSSSLSLPKGQLQAMRCKDLNLSDPCKSTNTAVQFHPSGELALTSGYDKTLRFFQVDPNNDIENGEQNKKVHGVFFPDLPITCASFTNDGGSSVLISGRRPFFYTYDVASGVVDKIPKLLSCGGTRQERSLEKFKASPDGRLVAFLCTDGYITIVAASSWQWVGEVKMSGTCRCVDFSPCSTYIYGSGSDGDVYKWDVRKLVGTSSGSSQSNFVSKFKNEDGTVCSSLAVSRGFAAVGAESGVVNIYDESRTSSYDSVYGFNSNSSVTSATGASNPNTNTSVRKPYKSIFNLTTSCDYLKFNHTGEILAVSSRREKDSLKLVHMPSGTVFQNWPTTKTPLGYVWCVDFSPRSGFMAVGNEKGKCLLYRLNHFNEA